MSLIGIDLGDSEARCHGIGRRSARAVGGQGQFRCPGPEIGERSLPQGAGQFQIGVPIGRLGKVRQSCRRFAEPTDVHVKPDTALGENGGLAGTLELFDSGELVRRQHLDDGETGREPEYRRNLTRAEASQSGLDLCAQGGRLDFAEEAAIERGGVDGFLACEYGEIGTLFDFSPEAG